MYVVNTAKKTLNRTKKTVIDALKTSSKIVI